MAEKCESNGDYGSDFKRNTKGFHEEQKEDEHNPSERKIQEYVKELLAEKLSVDQRKHPHASKLLDQEVSKVQTEGKIPNRDAKYVDILREKPIKVTVKVLVPVHEYPKFNFVGKLLGPKGNSLKRLQEETMCKMAILGRGSMKDHSKEEELRKSLDPKYAHLTDDLHVEISALGPAAEAHARIAFALAEIKKYLIPDTKDNIRMEQLREMESISKGFARNKPEPAPVMKRTGAPRVAPPRPPVPMRTATRMPVPTPRVMPAKTKIMSILDRARIAMEESYASGYGSYDRPYDDYALPTYSERHFNSEYSDDYVPRTYSDRHFDAEYDSDYYRDRNESYGEPSRRWKTLKKSTTATRISEGTHYRSSPYTRSTK